MAKRGHYGRWSESDLIKAIRAYRNGDTGLNECSRIYHVPKATIKRHADKKNVIRNEVKALGKQPTFSVHMEKILTEHILKLEECFFGLTIREIRKLAFDIAEKQALPHSFNKDKKIAGKKWFYAFMRRNPQLSLRKPEGTSLARARGFNRENVAHFYDILEKIVDEFQFTAEAIFNVDESGFTTVQKAQQKIVGRKGKRQVGSITSGERGVNTTMVCAVSAAGFYVPPMIIFKRKKFNNDLKIGAPPASIVTISDTGYINSELFVTWLHHFKNHVNCNNDKKVLLLLDGHTTHSRNLDACSFARDNGIILLQLPGHTTHRLQPLDVAFFGPLQKYFVQAQETFLRQNKGDKIYQTQISKLLNEAYGRAATVAIAESAFRASGIWPVNRHIFQDHQFASSDILQHQQCNSSTETTINTVNLANTSLPMLLNDNESKNNESDVNFDTQEKNKEKFEDILHEISPPPRSSFSQTKVIAQKAVIITSNHHFQELQHAKSKKQNSPKVMLKKQRVQNKENWFCAICEEIQEEEMIQCIKCHTWVHTECAGVSPRIKKYFCLNCA